MSSDPILTVLLFLEGMVILWAMYLFLNAQGTDE